MPFGSISRSSASFSSAGSFLDYEQILPKLKRGDLIEILRDDDAASYKHWVIVEKIVNGNVWCFHVGAAPGTTNEECIRTSTGSIRYEPLSDILKDTNSGRSSYCRVNNQDRAVENVKKQIGQEWPNINLDEVFKELHKLKGKEVHYNILTKNCEHYVTLWKYGASWSSQVDNAKRIAFRFGVGLLLI